MAVQPRRTRLLLWVGIAVAALLLLNDAPDFHPGRRTQKPAPPVPAPAASIPAARIHAVRLPQGRIECLALTSRILHRAVPYCVFLPPDYLAQPRRRFPVVYFFHGLGGNEQELVATNAWELIEHLWRRRRMRQFILVAPDGWSSFFINSIHGRFRWADFFRHELMPAIARRYRVLPGRRHRGLAGISMGGYGALRMAFAHPGEFAAVAVNSPALMRRPPAAQLSDPRLKLRLRFFGRVFGWPPRPGFWKRNSPLTLARHARLAGMQIYFDCGAQDGFGFYRGAEALNRELNRRHIPHQFHLYPGGHDWLYFAAHLPAALQFAGQAVR